MSDTKNNKFNNCYNYCKFLKRLYYKNPKKLDFLRLRD